MPKGLGANLPPTREPFFSKEKGENTPDPRGDEKKSFFPATRLLRGASSANPRKKSQAFSGKKTDPFPVLSP